MVRLASRRKKPPSVAAVNGTLPAGGTSLRMENVHVPAEIQEPQNPAWFRLGPIMTTILIVGLAWIAVVSWFASKMPGN